MTGGRGESRIHQRQQPSGLQRSRQRGDVLGRARDRAEGTLVPSAVTPSAPDHGVTHESNPSTNQISQR
jgi:hypothetical protein